MTDDCCREAFEQWWISCGNQFYGADHRVAEVAWKARGKYDAAQVDKLVEALRKYGSHKADCVFLHQFPRIPCDCGFEQALADYGNHTKQPKGVSHV